MKFKIIIITLFVGLLLTGLTSVSYAVDTTNLTGAAIAVTTAPGETGVLVNAFYVEEDASAGDTIAAIEFQDNSAGVGIVDADLAGVEIWLDVNENGEFDINDTPIDGELTVEDIDNGDTASKFEFAEPVTLPQGEQVYMLLRVNIAGEVSGDGTTFQCEAWAVLTDGGSTEADGTADNADDMTIDVTATHFQWVFLADVLADNTEPFSDGAAHDFLKAVDQYGNHDTDYGDDVVISATSYTDPSGTNESDYVTADTGSGLEATNAASPAVMADGLIQYKDDDAASDSILESFLIDVPSSMGITLIATGLTDGLVGTQTLAVGTVTDFTSTQIQGSRGIEFYDTDHNGKLDTFTVMFASPVTINTTTTAAFSVDGYTIDDTVLPAINEDNGGKEIFNAGPFGVTLKLNEGVDYDTGETPDTRYISSAGDIKNRAAGTPKMQGIERLTAVEVDKANPILISVATNDDNNAGTGIAENGQIDGVVLTFSEVVEDFEVRTTTVNKTSGDVGNYAFALAATDQNDVNVGVKFALANNVVNTENVYTIQGVEKGSSNTGLLPVLLYNENDAGGYYVADSSGNRLYTTFISYVADTAKDIDIEDGVSPVVNSITTADLDPSAGDGQIDQVTIVFSEDMNGWNPYAVEGVTFYTSQDPTFGSGSGGDGTYDVVSAAVTGNQIVYTIDEADDVYDTEVKVTLYYDRDAGTLLDANGFELAEYSASARIVPSDNQYDGARPIVVDVTTGDVFTRVADGGGGPEIAGHAGVPGADGRLDKLVFIFSEQIKAADKTDTADTNAESIVLNFTLQNAGGDSPAIEDDDAQTNAPVLSHDSEGDTSSTLTLYHNEIATADADATNGGDTDDLTGWKIAADGSDDIVDMNDVTIKAVAAFVDADNDGAAPFVMLIETGDLDGQVNDGVDYEDNGNGDGFIDNLLLYFSEIVSMEDANDVSGFSVDTSTATTENTIIFDQMGADKGADFSLGGVYPANATAPTIDDNDDDPVTKNKVIIYGTSDKNGDTDTGAEPTVDYDGSNGIEDASGNALALFTNKATVDKAKPVIYSAIGVVGKTEIVVTFSEDVQGAAAALDGLESDDYFGYFNDTTVTEDGATGISDDVISELDANYKFKIYTDAALTIDDVTNDLIFLHGGNALKDQADAPNIAEMDSDGILQTSPQISIRITINDIIPPYLTDAVTIDSDDNGWIDHVLLTFSEDLNDMSITGVVDADTDDYPDVPLVATSLWDIVGYTGETLNFFDNSAPDDSSVDDALTGADEAYEGEYFYAGNAVNDDMLLIRVDEESAGANAFSAIGDTDAQPALAFDAGITLADFKTNVFEPDPANNATVIAADETAYTIDSVRDGAGAVIMSSSLASETEMRIWLSEELNDDDFGDSSATQQFGQIFDLTVGTNQNTNWSSYVKDFDELDADANSEAYGYISVKWTQVWEITAGNTAAIRYASGAANLVDDLADDTIPAWYPTTATANGNPAVAAWLDVTEYDAPADPDDPEDPAAPSVTVDGPNGGEAFVEGATVNILWSSANVTTVDVMVSMDDGETWTAVGTGVTASLGKLAWTAEAGDNILAKVSDAESTASDRSDQVFSVVAEEEAPPTVLSVSLLSPNGGEMFVEGADVNVLWTAANIDMVDVMFSLDGGDVWESADANIDAALGKYVWTAVLGDNVLVKVADSDEAVEDRSDQVFTVVAEDEAPEPEPMVTVLSPNGGEAFVEGADVNVLWTAANIDMVDVMFSLDGGDVWECADANIDADLGKYVWTAVLGDNVLIKVADVDDAASDMSDQVFWVAAEEVEPEPESPPAIAKSALAPVPATEAQINPSNVEAVKFYGAAAAGDVVEVKLCDLLGNEVMIQVTANAKGNFLGVIDASSLDDGIVTMQAGVAVEGEDTVWYTFADYLKDAAALGAPSELEILDVPGDNGMWVYARFAPSENHFDRSPSDYYVVNSYVFYREVLLPDAADANDTTLIPWADVRGDIMADENDMLTVMLPAKDNMESNWKVVASTGTAVSSVTSAMKAGGAAVATLIDAADKAAGISVSAFSNVATGAAIDNIAPAPFVAFTADDNPEGDGVLVTWTAPTDVELKYQHGVVGSYTMMDQMVDIYGVNTYEVYRKTKTTDYVLVGTAGPGELSFVDPIANSSTVYKYYVKAVDDNIDHLVKTGSRSALAATPLKGDFNGDSVVGAPDFSIFAANYAKNFVGFEEDYVWSYDLNRDGTVNASDFSIFAAGYGAVLKAAKAATSLLPTSDMPINLSADIDETTSTYFVNVNFGKTENLKGFEFYLSYNTDALEYVQNSTSGLVGLNMTKVTEDGTIMVADWFVGNEFDGTVTLSFRSTGVNSDVTFEILNPVVDMAEGLSLTTNVEDLEVKALPTVYALSQNYPNPFNPTTTIDYSLPKSGNVELVIFNVTGQKVRTLTSGRQDAGFYKIVWNGRNDYGESVGSGLYIYKLVSGSFSKTVKMNLIK